MWPINTQQHGTLQNKKVHIRSSAQKIQDTVTHTVTHTHTMWAGLGLTGAALFIHTALLPVKAIQSTCAHTHTESDAPKVWLCNHKTLSIKNDRRRWWRREIWGEDVIYRVSNKSGEGRVGMLVWVRAATTSCWFPSHGCCTGKKKVFIFKMLLLWRETQWLLIYSTPSRGDYYCVWHLLWYTDAKL